MLMILIAFAAGLFVGWNFVPQPHWVILLADRIINAIGRMSKPK